DSPKPPKLGEERPAPPARRGSRVLRHWYLISLGSWLALLVVLAAFGPHLFDERLRRSLEGKINQHLTGYRVAVGHAHLNPLNLALGLHGLVIRQNANPEPPVADIPHLRLSVEWPALLTFRLVSNAVFD